MSRKLSLIMLLALSLGLASNALAYTITGTVTLGGSGLANVVTTASGGTQGTTTSVPTNASGAFTANHTSANPVTVTPTLAGYTFSPVNKTYNLTGSKTGCNFTATQLTYTISGNVGTLVGVTMNGLPGNPVTTSGGAYTATVGYGWNGTVTPAMTGYVFSPTNKTYANVTSNQTAQNYTPSAATYTISGTVGTLDGVTMNGLPGNPVTSGGGNYTATVNSGWTGTVTPAKTGYTFSPTNKTYSNVTANQTAQNYTPTLLTYTISGSVGTVDGVTMNGLPGNPVTAGGGAYSVTVNYGWTGTVTPAKTGYTFNPTNKTYSNVTANQSAQDYTPTLLTYVVSGTVSAVTGVTMSGFPDEVITTSGGAYSATVEYGWTGTVIPQMDGYTFSPTQKTYSNVTANQSSQNYTATLITFTISGHTGTLDGVTMNGLPGNPVTSGGGAYSATVTTLWAGTVTPSKTGYTFSPSSRMYSNVGANLTEDYTPIINTYTITGNVGTLSDVTMNGLPGNPLTTVGGVYSATVTYGWNGTVTPTRGIFTFSPSAKTYTNVTTDKADENYTVLTQIGDVNMVAWYTFNGNANDYSGYGYNGTVTGASYVTSDMGTVLDFEGADYVAIPSSVFSTVGHKVTICLWQYGDVDLNPQSSSIFEGTKAGSRILNAHLPWSNGSVYWDAGNPYTSQRVIKAASAAEYEGQWNHWAFTKDSEAQQMKVYLNGTLWASASAVNKGMAGVDTFKIGSGANGTSNYDGMICEFMVYDKVLTDEQIYKLCHTSYEAVNPTPANEATGVLTSADLSWTAGYWAGEHNVYLGTDIGLVTARDDSVLKATVAGTTYDPGTLNAGVTYFWAIDEVNDFYANSPWKSDVWSFTTTGGGPKCPLCGGDGLCDLSVGCYNGRLGRITGNQNVNIVQVNKAGLTSQTMGSLQSGVNQFINFVDQASFGRLSLKLNVSRSMTGSGTASTVRNQAVNFADSLPGDPVITCIGWPKGLFSYNNAGNGHAFISNMTSFDHESGHVIGLAHSGAIMDDGKRDSYRDSSSRMSAYPSLNFALNQQNWLGWFKEQPNLILKINDCLSKKPYVDITLRPLGMGGVPGEIPYGFVYEIPNSDGQIWVAIPKAVDSNLNAIKGGEIFIYSANKQIGCGGICMNSTREGRIANPQALEPHAFMDGALTIEPLSYVKTDVQFDGRTVPNYSQITMRVSLTGTVIDPNQGGEPDPNLIANWEFTEASGTALRDTANDGITTPASWTANRTGITATGADMLNYAPATNTIDGSVTYFDLAGAGKAFTTGTVWTVMEVNDFTFAGTTTGERLRFGFVNAMANGNMTGEFNLRRVNANSIQLMNYAGGTMPNTGVEVCNSSTFTGSMEIATKYDFDARTMQTFYRLNGTGSFTSIGNAISLYSTNVGNALRLCAGENASTGNGAWTNTGEFFHIGRIYLTTADPTVEPANVEPIVDVTYPNDGATFTPGSNITLKALAEDSDGTISSVSFYRAGSTLIGNGTVPAAQSDIICAASEATLHGATIRSSGGTINSWTVMTDYPSWTKTVNRSGTFEVYLNYSCNTDSAGSDYRIEVDNQTVYGTTTATASDWNTYNSILVGTVQIGVTGSIQINVIAETKPGPAVMNIKDVTLIPVDLDDVYQYTWNNVQAGTYSITAKTTDDDGGQGESDPIVITVQ